MTEYVYLVYCDSFLTGLTDPPCLELIEKSFEVAKQHLDACAYPGHVERWPVGALPTDDVETVYHKSTYDHDAIELEKKEWLARRQKAEQIRETLQDKLKRPKGVNWT